MKRNLNKLFYGFMVLWLFPLLVSPISAQEATDSQDLIREKIKERLEKSVSSQVKGIQEELENKPKKKAYAGTILSINNNLIRLDTDFGERQVEVADEAEIFYYEPNIPQEAIELSLLEPEDYVVTMGLLSNDGFEAKRIIKTPQPEEEEERKLIFGKITEVDGKKLKFSKTLEAGKEDETLEIDEDTLLEIKGQEEAVAEDIQIGDRLYAVVIKSNDKITAVKTVLIIPGQNSPLNEENLKEATKTGEEASPTALP